MPKIRRKPLLKGAAALVALFVFYLALLCFPEPFFTCSVSASNLTLYSDVPFAEGDGRRVLEIAAQKLERSPLYSQSTHHSIFICNARWRQMLFFNKEYGVGGVNYYPLTSNVFLRNAIISDDLLISTSGRPVAPDRPLDYFIAHEIAHTLAKNAAGSYHHLSLPEYVREGYPDYIAKGSAFNYEEARSAFLSGAPEMDRWRSGLYLRYHLLVAHLLDKEGWSIERLLKNPPEQASVEEAIKSGMPDERR
jgi:hypothetical protein